MATKQARPGGTRMRHLLGVQGDELLERLVEEFPGAEARYVDTVDADAGTDDVPLTPLPSSHRRT